MFNSFSFAENTVGFIIDDKFNDEIITKLHKEIEDKLKKYDKINLYLEDANIQSFALSAVVDDILFKFKNSEHFAKVALVTDRKWIQACAAIENFFFEGTVRTFPSEERMDAMNWIAISS